MKTITILLDATILENPDLDLRYAISKRIEEITDKRIYHDGFDYLGENGNIMAIFHAVEEEKEDDLPRILELIRNERFLNNYLSLAAKVYIKDDYPNEDGDFSDCTLVFPI